MDNVPGQQIHEKTTILPFGIRPIKSFKVDDSSPALIYYSLAYNGLWLTAPVLPPKERMAEYQDSQMEDLLKAYNDKFQDNLNIISYIINYNIG